MKQQRSHLVELLTKEEKADLADESFKAVYVDYKKLIKLYGDENLADSEAYHANDARAPRVL
eukprot:SAG11_NODE_13504_length_652_cov_1.108499_1_plen_62_part_00